MKLFKASLVVLFALTLGAVSAPPPPDPPVDSLPFYKDTEVKFAEFFKSEIKATTDSTASFDGNNPSGQWSLKEAKKFGVATTREWLFPRFTIIVPDPLTKADELNGIEFRGIAVIQADAVRVSRRNPDLNDKWDPSGGFAGMYSMQRTKGTWKIEPYSGGTSSAWKFPRENWLCAKPRPPAPIADQKALQAEARNAFEKCKRAPIADGFTLLFHGADRSMIKEHLIEYRGTGEPQFNTAEVSAADQQNGIEYRFDLGIRVDASRYKDIKLRARRSDEAVPRASCSVGLTEVTGKWDKDSLTILAQKEKGMWHFTASYGEIIRAD